MKFLPRESLPHDPPFWVAPAREIYFVTVCCAQRRVNQLAFADTATALSETIKHRNDSGIWFVQIAVIMPDHIHMLVSTPPDRDLKKTIAKWKEWTTKSAGVRWQRDFFDHRLRREESLTAKGDYILNNPVRAGLVPSIGDWPFSYIANTQGAAARTPLPL